MPFELCVSGLPRQLTAAFKRTNQTKTVPEESTGLCTGTSRNWSPESNIIEKQLENYPPPPYQCLVTFCPCLFLFLFLFLCFCSVAFVYSSSHLTETKVFLDPAKVNHCWDQIHDCSVSMVVGFLLELRFQSWRRFTDTYFLKFGLHGYIVWRNISTFYSRKRPWEYIIEKLGHAGMHCM